MEGFIDFIKDYAKQDVKAVIIGLRSCGFDIFMERVYPADHHSILEMSWSFPQDEALVKYGNILSAKLNCSAMKISPNEIYLTDAELASENFKCLQSTPIEDIRTHYAILISFNESIENYLLPFVDFRCTETYPHSIADYIQKGRNLIFHEVNCNLLKKLLNASWVFL